MSNMNNEKENIEKNDEDAFSAEVDTPLIDIVSTGIGYLHFNNVTEFPVIKDTLRKNLTVKGPDELQNQNKIGSANIHKGRILTKCFFTKQVRNDRNNLIPRCWFLYSPKEKSLNCFCCLLFGKENSSRSHFTKAGGFWKWKTSEKTPEHEASQSHRDCFTAWKQTERRNTLVVSIDDCIEEQIRDEIDVILFLAKQDHAFRGHFESLHLDGNHGNFLELMKLIARYDPILENHLKTGKDNPHSVHYFSHKI